MWFGAKTSLWYHGNQGQAFGRAVDCVFIHFDNMLAATITLILHLFVGTEGDIMYIGLWIATLFDGGCGICQSPFVINILRDWRKSDCGHGATLGHHISGHSKCLLVKKPVAIRY